MIINRYTMDYTKLENYPDYKIYKNGKIVRHRKKSKNGNTLKRRVISPTKAKNGYRTVRLMNKDGVLKSFYLHRLIWQAFNGDIPEGLEVCHEDCNRDNNRLSNLRLLTHTQNCRNPQSIKHYRTANQLSKGKYNKERLLKAQTTEYEEELIRTYKRLVKEHGHCGVYMLMKEGHCGYPRAKRIVCEMECKTDANQ